MTVESAKWDKYTRGVLIDKRAYYDIDYLNFLVQELHSNGMKLLAMNAEGIVYGFI